MRKRICFFGGSTTLGVGDSGHSGWVDRLKAAHFADGRSADVYNLGISGDNTDDILKRFESEARARSCDTLIFVVGMNDSQFLVEENRNMIPIEEFERNLRQIAEKAKHITSSVTFVGPTRVDESRTTPPHWNQNVRFTNDMLEKYDEAIKQITEETGVNYIDLSGAVTSGELTDGLHPNSAGHKKIYKSCMSQMV